MIECNSCGEDTKTVITDSDDMDLCPSCFLGMHGAKRVLGSIEEYCRENPEAMASELFEESALPKNWKSNEIRKKKRNWEGVTNQRARGEIEEFLNKLDATLIMGATGDLERMTVQTGIEIAADLLGYLEGYKEMMSAEGKS